MELIARNLVKRYGDQLVLDGVSLTAGPGVVALLGPNGSGKSTLLRILATVLTPDAGAVAFGGRPYAQDPRPVRRVLGYLPQHLDLEGHLTPMGLLRYMAALKGVPADPALLEALDLPPDRPVPSLSGGEARRLGMAQALLGNPRLLVLDEPTAGLDPEERDRALRLVNQPGSGRVVVLSSHLPGEVEAFARQVVVLKEGRAVYAGPVSGLREQARGRVFEVCVPAAQVQGRLQEWLVSRVSQRAGQAVLRTVGPQPPGGAPVAPGLEDAYLWLQKGVESCAV